MSTENKETLHINDDLSNEEYGHNLDDSTLETVTGGAPPVATLTRSLSANAGSIEKAGMINLSTMPKPSGAMDRQFASKYVGNYTTLVAKPTQPLI